MSYYQITALSSTEVDIRIDGPIGNSFFEETVTAKSFTSDLSKITANKLNVYINSPGGSVMDANVIFAALKRHPAQVYVVIDGYALSAASMIAMAGDSISMGERSLMMIHNPQIVTNGDANAIRKTADVLDKIKIGMVDLYNARLCLEPGAVGALLDQETWYSASEALSAGLVDKVVLDSATPKLIPTAICKQFNHIPAVYAAYMEANMPNENVTSSHPDQNVPEVPADKSDKAETITCPKCGEVIDLPTVDPSNEKTNLNEIAAIAASVVEQSIIRERKRIKEIRAAFAVWEKRGWNMDALKAECEDEGLDYASVGHRILAYMGSQSMPLAGATQGIMGSSDPLMDAVAIYKSVHPGITDAQAQAGVLREKPELYDAYQSTRQGG